MYVCLFLCKNKPLPQSLIIIDLYAYDIPTAGDFSFKADLKN